MQHVQMPPELPQVMWYSGVNESPDDPVWALAMHV